MLPPYVQQFIENMGVDDQPHSNRTFIEHLAGTYDLLKQFGHSEEIALAGALHSIYGTQTYRLTQSTSRDNVRALIGDEAETLVYLFCTIDRRLLPSCTYSTIKALTDRVTKRSIVVSDDQFNALVAIEAANLIEQGPVNTNSRLFTYARANKLCP